MMHHVPQAGLTVPAVAGPVERVVRPHSQRSYPSICGFARQVAQVSAVAKLTQAKYGARRTAATRLMSPEADDADQDEAPQHEYLRECPGALLPDEEQPSPEGVRAKLGYEEPEGPLR